MASPFRLFRKYVKPLLAVFVVMLMLSWVVGDSLMSYLSSARNAEGERNQLDARATAVKWDGGSLTNQQIDQLKARRQIVNGFLRSVEIKGAEMAYRASVEPSPLRVQRLLGPETPQQGIEQSVVQTRLFADAARQAGMRVSDESIVQYLVDLGRGNVSPQEMRDMLNQLQQRLGRASIDEVMSALREEMLARNYIAANQYAFLTVTPEQRWKDWLRVNERVVVEAAAIPAESMLLDVKEPTDAELEAFFDKYKNDEPVFDLGVYRNYNVELPSPTPGFKIPRKIDVQYIEGNYDSFVAKAEEKVTDEEILKYYEDNKDQLFVKTPTDLFEEKGEDASKSEDVATPDSKGETDAKPADTTAPPAEGEAPAEGKTNEERKPADAGETPPPPVGEKEEVPEESKQSSLDRTSRKSVFHLTAFQEDAPKDDAAQSDAPISDAPAATETKPADPTPAEPATDAKPADPAPPAAPATTTSPLTGSGLPEIPGVPAIPGITTPAAAPAEPKKPVEYQPLEEVKDVARRKVAEQKVQGELDNIAKEIERQLDGDFRKYFEAEVTAEAEKKPAPAPPASLTDLAPLAAKYGLKSGTTGPLTAFQMRETPIGKTGLNDPDNPRSFMQMLFLGKELDLYQPVSTKDIFNNHFLASKKSDTPGHVPTLAEVRDEVVKAWKLQKAAELAEKRATELAKKAEEAKTPLPEFFADQPEIKVVRTDQFSELTGGDVGIVNGQPQQQPYRLSQPNDLVAPGPAFMRRVFQLKDGQVAAMLNNDHSIAYVVRLVEHEPSLNELRTAYLAEANSWPGLYNMTLGHIQDVRSNLESNILAASNLKWERDADKIEQGDSPDDGG